MNGQHRPAPTLRPSATTLAPRTIIGRQRGMASLLDHISRRASGLVDAHGRRSRRALLRLRRRIATGLGALVLGLAALTFAKLGDVAQLLFARIVAVGPYLPLVLTPALFAVVVYATLRWTPEARGSGIPQVIAAARDPQREATGPLVSMRTAIAKVGMTLLMLLGGGSVGREGPTVQLSAAIMVAVHRVLRVPIGAGVLIAGGAAGVAAAFNTPLAGVAFAIEELASAYEQKVAVLVMAAVMIAGLVSLLSRPELRRRARSERPPQSDGELRQAGGGHRQIATRTRRFASRLRVGRRSPPSVAGRV